MVEIQKKKILGLHQKALFSCLVGDIFAYVICRKACLALEEIY